MKKIKILIIEDNEPWQNQYQIMLGETFTILSALSLEDARRLFKQNPDVDLIVVDACVNDQEKLDSLDLIAEIRKTFTGPMIASSRSPDFQKILVRAGCDHQASKAGVPNKVLEILAV